MSLVTHKWFLFPWVYSSVVWNAVMGYFTLCTSWCMGANFVLVFLVNVFVLLYDSELFISYTRWYWHVMMHYGILLFWLIMYIIYNDGGDDSGSILYFDLDMFILHYIISISWIISVDRWCLLVPVVLILILHFYTILMQIWVLATAVKLSSCSADIPKIRWALEVLSHLFPSIFDSVFCIQDRCINYLRFLGCIFFTIVFRFSCTNITKSCDWYP